MNKNKPQQTALTLLKQDEYDEMKKGFHGGRTEVFKQYQEWTDDKNLKREIW